MTRKKLKNEKKIRWLILVSILVIWLSLLIVGHFKVESIRTAEGMDSYWSNPSANTWDLIISNALSWTIASILISLGGYLTYKLIRKKKIF